MKNKYKNSSRRLYPKNVIQLKYYFSKILF